MKQYKDSIFSILVLVMVMPCLLSCSQESEHTPGTSQVAATFTSTISEPATRMEPRLLATRAAGNQWSQSITVGILPSDGSDFRLHTPSSDATRTQLLPTDADQTIYYPLDGSSITFTAFAPYPSEEDIAKKLVTAVVDNVVTYVLDYQSYHNVNYMEKFDFIYHKGTVGYNQHSPLATLNFEHRLSRVVVNITRTANHAGSLKDIYLDLDMLLGCADCNVLTGEVTSYGTSSTFIPYRVTNEDATQVFEAIVAPQDKSQEADERLIRITIDGNYYEVPIPEIYESGQSYEYNLTYGQGEVKLLGCTITPWITAPGNTSIGTVTGALPPGWEDLIDWDQEESNCYIANPNSYLVIPISRAAAFSATEHGKDHPVLAEGETFIATYLWQDAENVLSDINPVNTIGTGPNGYLLVQTGADQGNAVVAVKNQEGTILWSWHVWVVKDYEPTSAWMDRNLGAISNVPPTSATDVSSLGLYYQWGRKDPFPGTTTLETASGRNPDFWTPTANLEATDYSVGFSIKNPTKFMVNTNYVGSSGNSSWGPNAKTIFDPCPVGYRVPHREGNWGTEPGSTIFGWLERVSNNAQYNANFGGYYITAGVRGNTAAGLAFIGTAGYYWSAVAHATDLFRAYNLQFSDDTVTANYDSTRRYGFSVRCVKDQ